MSDLYACIAGPKRHLEFLIDGETFEITDRTETGVGGFFVDASAMCGRALDGGRRCTLAAAEREVRLTLAHRSDPEVLRPAAPWEQPSELPFAAIRALEVTTHEVAKTLPAQFRRPGTRYLEGINSRLRRDIEPPVVALDPGGDRADWPTYPWVNRQTGGPVRVTTDPEDLNGVLLETLDQRAIDWATKPPPRPIGRVIVHPDRVRIVGAVSGVIDADLDGFADPGSHRPIYRELDRLTLVQGEAKRRGKRAFMRRTGLSEGTAQRAATGKPISRSATCRSR